MEKYLGMSSEKLRNEAEEIIGEIRRRAYGEGYEQGKFDERMDEEFRHNRETDQEARDRIVKQAKEDIEGLRTYNPSYPYVGMAYYIKDSQVRGMWRNGFGALTYVEFIVNKKKRTVVALMKGVNSDTLYAKGIAKCAPTDCFNSHIGKAMAIRRAMGLEVPDEYMNAPQPTEIRVGDEIYLCNIDTYQKYDFRYAKDLIEAQFRNGDIEIVDDSRDTDDEEADA